MHIIFPFCICFRLLKPNFHFCSLPPSSACALRTSFSGDRKSVDVAAVHFEGRLQRVVTSLVSYGYFGDLMQSSERWRCLGPPRYMLSGVQQVLRNRSYPVQVKVRKNKSFPAAGGSGLSSSASCNSLCSVCSFADGPPPPSAEDEWEEVITSRFISI